MARRPAQKRHQTQPPPKGLSANEELDATAAEGESRDLSHPDEERAESLGGVSGIPVVGLGGSAGSLKSFESFFAAMPADSGAAFVVLQHLAPAHTSLLPELVGQHTRMKVVQARDAVPVEPNCVYVIPPSQYLGIREGVLYLTEPVKQGGMRMPIDFFFRSLAEDRQQRAIGILFSGAGSDGTLGVRSIRGGGGLAIAQDPNTAQFDTMPRSAIATGLVDYVLPTDKMPEAILEYLRHPYVRGEEPAAVLETGEKPEGVQNILALVLAQTGCDFRCYKKSTILRRIERRMGLRQISNVAQYSDLLSQDTHEVSELLKDLLVNVTSFFRDAAAFEELRERAVRRLVEVKPSDGQLRVWVPGCASGEEAYSLAMLLIEETAAARKNCAVQVFATDIDEEALRLARLGMYPESIVADVEADTLSKFFIRTESGYQVSEPLRRSVTFASQNLITDPPFSKMDLISCRSLLIYLDADTQAKLTRLFNFALNPGGYLFLGKSEGIGGRNDLFDLVSKKARLYRRLTPVRPITVDSPVFPGRKMAISAVTPGAVRPPVTAPADMIRQALLSHFSASVVLVDRRGQVIQFHGQTGKYLNMPMAEPTLNLLEIAKQGLSPRLRSAMHTAIEDGKTVELGNVPITRDEGSPFVRLTVVPAAQRGETEPLLAVIFEDVPRPATVGVELAQSGESETAVKQLEEELKSTQHYLQSTIDDIQASNEELRLANEEVISTNEELQSTNEELETSKEELQSVNEELMTVNSQLQEKVHQLDTANGDMANLLKSTEIATLFLDNELRIKFFSPAMTRVLNLIAADMGRPLTHLSMDLIGCDLAAEAKAVIQGASVTEKEVRHVDGSSYFVRVVPYRTQLERVDGVVIAFIDLTNLRRVEKQLADVVESSNDAIFAKSLDGTILTWNPAAAASYGYPAAEAIGRNVSMTVPPDRMSELAEIVERIKCGESVNALETERVRKDGRKFDVSLSMSPMRDASGQIVGISTVAQDITERKRAASNQALMTGVLRILNRGGDDLQLVLRDALQLIRESTAFDAVGLRMRNGDDYPYYEQNGFSDEFLQAENRLCARSVDGAIVRDADGRVTLECTCGSVLSGQTDPSMPCFTNNGGFWTNASSELLALAPEADPRTNPRNRCIHAGYESVGLFPVRSGEEILGLLQLNDRREGRFDPEFVRFLESLADNIGLAIKRKQAEEALGKAAEELTRSNQDLDQFASMVSHDLQEPLRTVSGFVQLLQKKYANQLDADADRFIQYAVSGAERMAALIRGLLAYARVGTRSKEPAPVDAEAALRQALVDLFESIQATGAKITHDALPTVRADLSQLVQLLQNLIGNALKFRSEAPPAIHVGARREGDDWQFSVSDNGIGIDPRFQGQIFDLFQRLHAQEQYAGSGIGLAICKKIVERHGGRIWVESEAGQGATFRFTIPA